MTEAVIEGLRDRISKAIKIHQSIGVIVPMNNYADLFESIMDQLLSSRDELWIYLTVTKSYDTLVKSYKSIADRKNIKFVDCISRAAGISRIDKNCVYIESPVLLEKIIIEILHIAYDAKKDVKKYLVIDSLSALMIYNNPETVKEFFQHLINKARSEDIHTITIVIEEELDDYMNKIVFLNEKIIKVKESFI
ncbi:MAG: hypothetical protein QXS02_03995 [Candidatus Thermoplasmatota archaeon]